MSKIQTSIMMKAKLEKQKQQQNLLMSSKNRQQLQVKYQSQVFQIRTTTTTTATMVMLMIIILLSSSIPQHVLSYTSTARTSFVSVGNRNTIIRTDQKYPYTISRSVVSNVLLEQHNRQRTTIHFCNFQQKSPPCYHHSRLILNQQQSQQEQEQDQQQSSSSSSDDDSSHEIDVNGSISIVEEDVDESSIDAAALLASTATPFDGIPAEQVTDFSPSYLLQLDNYRGYRRKIVLRRLYNITLNDVKLNDNKKEPFYKKIISNEFFDDISRRKLYYKSDWIDAFKSGSKQKTIPAILFLYFACLSPAVSFGTIASQITMGSMGIVEFLLSAGVSGMLYALLCGQPMTFIAPTGLTLAFISGLYRFCSVQNLPFFPVYSWVGLWTSFMFILLGLGGSSQLIRFCTRFTDEIFNALLSINFMYEASVSLKRNFEVAPDKQNLTMPFVAFGMAIFTAITTRFTAQFESSKYLNQKLRTIVKNFGPVSIFILMTCINQLSPWMRRLHVPRLIVPNTFQLSLGRSLFINLNAIPIHVKLLCGIPAVLLSLLFFMDQNISVRVVNNPDNKLQKGSAYNLDMVALGIITGLTSIVGLPWMCGATVQSLSHVRAMTETRFNSQTLVPEIVQVTETRTTGFIVHALLAGSLFLLPLLSYVPIPVVSGIFLFLGRKLMSGNSFLTRIRDLFVETSRLPDDHPIKYIGRKKTTIFTVIQVLCLGGLWTFKQNSKTAILFPSLIGLLIITRSYILPKYFTERELVDLGDPTPC